MSFRPGDSKREEFRKYLEKAGILDALAKILTSLYEEQDKPADALEYLKHNLKVTPEVHSMHREIDELRNKVEQLSLENENLKEQVSKYEKAKEWPSISESQN